MDVEAGNVVGGKRTTTRTNDQDDGRATRTHRPHHHPRASQKVPVGGMLDLNSLDDHSDDDDDELFDHHEETAEDEGMSHETSTLGWKETRQVRRFRFLVLLFLFLSGIFVSYGIFAILRNNEKDTMESHFRDQAIKVVDSFQYTVQHKLGTLDALSVAMTSYGSTAAYDTNPADEPIPTALPWPNATMGSFAMMAGDVQALIDSLTLVYSPVVMEDASAGPVNNVAPMARLRWEEYSVTHQDDWIPTSLEYEEQQAQQQRRQLDDVAVPIHSTISTYDDATGAIIRLPQSEAYQLSVKDSAGGDQFALTHMPAWQTVPVMQDMINIDFMAQDEFGSELARVLSSKQALIGSVTVPDSNNHILQALLHDQVDSTANDVSPISKWYFPIFETFSSRSGLAGVLTAVIPWDTYFQGILPPDTPTMDIVLTNSCEPTVAHTFRIVAGQEVDYVGVGDHHENNDVHVESSNIFKFDALSDSIANYRGVPLQQMCESYTLHLYPTDETRDEYYTDRPWYFVILVASIFTITILILLCYDRNVDARQRIVLHKAEQAGDIVKSMFPAAVRRRLYDEHSPNGKHESMADDQTIPGNKSGNKAAADTTTLQNNSSFHAKYGSNFNAMEPEKMKIKSFLNQNPAAKEFAQLKAKAFSMGVVNASGPMADTFPETTILFADIVGFTAWSSEREPQQVFILLQTLYYNFDALAKKYLVFKVETIGDCYVAATGLPEPQPDHALRMSRFAAQCLSKMNEVTRSLEISLGPDTGELRMRVGLHSGPVAAGVLKGEKTRFQLFGDTVNTAARMESNGQISRIHCSGDTAKLLMAAGKTHWVREREDIIEAKGKGQIQTYWITPRSTGDVQDEEDVGEAYVEPSPIKVFDISIQSSRQQRLVDWNVEVLSALLKQIAAVHIDTGVTRKPKENPSLRLQEGSTALNEVTEIIRLPDYDENVMKLLKTDPETLELDELVVAELKDYVTTIASMYQPNSFHNFEHASHVTQSTSKLLKRIVLSENAHAMDKEFTRQDLHAYSHGLATDPLTQFTLVFCALIHDVDHPGVSNFQLVTEETTLAQVYKNKSVAEQNSVDIAWDLLMDEKYSNLRSAIYCNQKELVRFRQTMVNIVLATDIFDKDMKAIRDKRWAKAFADNLEEGNTMLTAAKERESPLSEIDGINLKATIVIEHLIQASDVSHTMQHFDIYMKWNERLFKEMYGAYEMGRAGKDPSLGWFKGEIWFFDNYVIPLARKLDECGVFGAHSQEYLNYALQNRKRFGLAGQQAVADFKARYEEEKAKGKKMSLNPDYYG